MWLCGRETVRGETQRVKGQEVRLKERKTETEIKVRKSRDERRLLLVEGRGDTLTMRAGDRQRACKGKVR